MAQLAVNELERRGVPHNEISVLMAQKDKDAFAKIETNDQALEGAGLGGAIGSGAGALAAGLTAVAGLAVPGVGLLAAGPLVAALTGAGAGAAAGGTVGALAGLAGEKKEVTFHEEMLTKGNILVAVATEDKTVCTVAEAVMNELALESKSTTGRVAQT